MWERRILPILQYVWTWTATSFLLPLLSLKYWLPHVVKKIPYNVGATVRANSKWFCFTMHFMVSQTKKIYQTTVTETKTWIAASNSFKAICNCKVTSDHNHSDWLQVYSHNGDRVSCHLCWPYDKADGADESAWSAMGSHWSCRTAAPLYCPNPTWTTRPNGCTIPRGALAHRTVNRFTGLKSHCIWEKNMLWISSSDFKPAKFGHISF